MILDKDTWFKQAQLRTKTVNIPEIGDVVIREISYVELTKLRQNSGGDDFEKMLEVVVNCADFFEGRTIADVKTLSPGLLTPIVNTLAKEILELSGLSESSIEDAKKN